MKKQGVADHVRSTYYTTVMSIGYGGPTYNTHPPTMLFTIGLSERAILVIRLKIDLRIHNTGARINVVSGKHASSATSHWKPV